MFINQTQRANIIAWVSHKVCEEEEVEYPSEKLPPSILLLESLILMLEFG